MHRRFATILVCALLAVGEASAAEYVVTQKNMTFSVTALTIKVGDSVSFRNADTMVHNVFSTSEAKPFDLGPEDPGKVQKVVFDHVGTVDVECAIHELMHLKIIVNP
jgi:plastocyanin